MLIFKYVLRTIRGSGARSLLIICSIMISAMVVFLNFTTNDDVVHEYQQLQKSVYREYDLLVNGKSLYFDIHDLGYEADDINAKIELCYYVIENREEEGSYYKLVGTDIKSLKENELITLNTEIDKDSVIISEKTAERYKLGVGDEISWTALDGEHTIEITAVAEGEGLLKMDSTFPVIILGQDMLEELTGLDSQISAVLFDVKDDVEVSDVAKEMEDGNEDFQVTNLANNQQMQNTLGLIRMILLVILLIVILLNIYIVTSNSNVLLEKRLYTLGIFRSVGATQGKVVGILVLENMIYGIIGSVLGLRLGLVLRKPIVSAFTGTNVTDTVMGSEMISYFIFTVVFAISLQIVCTLGKIIGQSRKSIRSILFDKINVAFQANVAKSVISAVLVVVSIIMHYINNTYNILFAGISCVCVIFATIFLLPLLLKVLSKLFSEVLSNVFGCPVGMGMRNLGYSKPACSNVTLITVTLMIVLSVFMLSNSLSCLIQGASSQFECDIRVTSVSENAENYEFLDENEYVESVEASYYSANMIKMNEITLNFVMVGLEKEYQGICELEGKEIANLKQNETLLDEYYAARLGMKVGDKLTISCEEYIEEELELEIVGFVDSSQFSTTRNVLVMSTQEYTEKISKIPSVLNVSVVDGKSVEDAKESIRRDFTQYDVVVETVDEYLDMQMASTNGIINMVWIILLLSVLLALVGIINNTVLGFMQRKREYAVLISTSMSRWQVFLMILCEIIFTVFFGCLFAFGITMWLSVVLSDLLYAIGICITVNVDMQEMVLVSGITFVALMFTALVPVVNLKKMILVNELKCDS